MKRMRGNGEGRKEYLWAAKKNKEAKMGIYD